MSGSVLDSAGMPVAAMVNLQSEVVAIGPNTGPGAAGLDLHADAAPDGTFTVENVPPGPYMLVATLPFTAGAFAAGGDAPAALLNPLQRFPESVVMPLVVTGEDVTGLSLVTRAAGRMEGEFVADTGVTRRLPPNLRVSLRSAQGTGMSMTMGALYGQGFRLSGMAGTFRIDVEGVPSEWAVKAILVNGEDVIDEAIDLKGETATLRIVMTDRVTTVSGAVQAPGERTDPEAWVWWCLPTMPPGGSGRRDTSG